MIHHLTNSADHDIRSILRDTLDLFGPNQVRVYADLIDSAIKLVADEPGRAGSLERSDLAPGCRSLHLGRAASRKGAAAHALYHMVGYALDGREAVIILRVLHEHMEPRSRVVRAMRPASPQ